MLHSKIISEMEIVKYAKTVKPKNKKMGINKKKK
jgi:hypothetical protein